MQELFFWMIAAGTCLGGALVAMKAQQQGDMLSVGIIMVICFVKLPQRIAYAKITPSDVF
jgi:hypothetical protein